MRDDVEELTALGDDKNHQQEKIYRHTNWRSSDIVCLDIVG